MGNFGGLILILGAVEMWYVGAEFEERKAVKHYPTTSISIVPKSDKKYGYKIADLLWVFTDVICVFADL